MPWSTSRPGGSRAKAKYSEPEYLATRKRLMDELKAAGQGTCAERICVMRSRLITPDMKLHLCHDRVTGDIRGLGHASCNTSEAARYARSLQNAPRLRW